jgi:hypothetical protein
LAGAEGVITLVCPPEEAEGTFLSMAERTRAPALRGALLSAGGFVAQRAAEYLRLAPIERLFTLQPQANGLVDEKQLSGVYDRVLVKGKGRPLYNRIKSGAKLNRCPLCGLRDVKTLDHYLPKAHFPELAVFPANLIPSCSDCNKQKLAHLANDYTKQTFHPYFDNWSTHRILHANVAVTDTVTVSYSIKMVEGFSRDHLRRAKNHFSALCLGELYSANAAVELVEAKGLFRNYFEDGPEVLRAELALTAQSRERRGLNAWNACLYWGLVECEEFWKGGFNLIEE